MTIEKCDNCRKTIKDDKSLTIRVGFHSLDLCGQCSEAIIKILNKGRLLQDGLRRAGLVKV